MLITRRCIIKPHQEENTSDTVKLKPSMEGIISVEMITEYARENISPVLIYTTILLTVYIRFNR